MSDQTTERGADQSTDVATAGGDTETTWLQQRALAMIETYQRAFEGRPSPCRFYPTCSSYAHEAFAVHGTGRGAWLTVRRLLRCRPLGPSGFDPVPEARESTGSRRSEKGV